MVVITLFCYNKGYVMQKTSLSMKALNKAGEFTNFSIFRKMYFDEIVFCHVFVLFASSAKNSSLDITMSSYKSKKVNASNIS